ncbi:hypothetical protein BAUCODRAFT_39287 [Baudoinia panamericana UAMH 10762]|uniref:Uncharacterized protein n=1 Tax=Baudoinia panamericana (strain UAMH 10762) TaxID=717646 RepID=M2MWY9_BAUPA|nr:uncharacterized protein BAUCODRAFT_39287 [Baudoinia panamericana UAMH 10762]EMC91144.1 hypothetical protein BAUCODRAFT_39287 [Baudoinia panamericana UAMH 10762]
MAHMSRRRRRQAITLLALAALPSAYAQLTNIPTLGGTTTTTSPSTTATTAHSTSQSTSATTTATSASSASTTATTSTSGAPAVSLSNLPTIAGAGIPTLIVPDTAHAPFMQKSSLPEGTVFIAVGGVLAFLGACVLLWRGLIAWSVNHSVQKAAMASIRGMSEKAASTFGGGGGSGGGMGSGRYNPIMRGGGNGGYKEMAFADGGAGGGGRGSSVSLDALTSAGRHVSNTRPRLHSRDFHGAEGIQRENTPPAGLFFSPTAHAGRGGQSETHAITPAHNRTTSSYLPAGYYASPSAQAGGGATTTTLGGAPAPYGRHSVHNPSPPTSPGLPPSTRSGRTPTTTTTTTYTHTHRAASRDGLRGTSRDRFRAPDAQSARTSYLDPSASSSSARQASTGGGGLYAQPSSSSLMVGVGGQAGAGLNVRKTRESSRDGLAGGRAPSAYLEEMFENHGRGPRERF